MSLTIEGLGLLGGDVRSIVVCCPVSSCAAPADDITKFSGALRETTGTVVVVTLEGICFGCEDTGAVFNGLSRLPRPPAPLSTLPA